MGGGQRRGGVGGRLLARLAGAGMPALCWLSAWLAPSPGVGPALLVFISRRVRGGWREAEMKRVSLQSVVGVWGIHCSGGERHTWGFVFASFRFSAPDRF